MTASNINEQEVTQQGVRLSPQQIQAAAQAAVQLIREGRVNVPSDMAMNGTLGVLNGFLTSIAQGSVVLIDPKTLREFQEEAEARAKKLAASKKAASKKTKR